MHNSFLKLLRCPICGSPLDFSVKIVYDNDHLEWGTLMCIDCKDKFPVALGIPIFKESNDYVDVNTYYKVQNKIIHKGPLVKDMIAKIEGGNIELVKKELMFFPLARTSLRKKIIHSESLNLETKLTRILPDKISNLFGTKNLYFIYWILTKLSLQDLRFTVREKIIYKKLFKVKSAIEFMELYFKLSGQREMQDYFKYRFGQPRYLAALDLLTVFPKNQKPIIDIACGTGHLIHYLGLRNPKQPIVGMDRDFAQLYIAKKFISPQSNYFCSDSNQKLPFQSNSFAGVLCSDAFQYFDSKERTSNEMKRIVASDGVVCITRVSNHTLPGYYGIERIKPKELKKYFNDIQNMVLGEDGLVNRYTKKLGPDLSKEKSMKELNNTNWISIIASPHKDIFHHYHQFDEWPHMLGCLRLNPLYHETGSDEQGNKSFQFKFPNSWYEYENINWKKYAPDKIIIDKRTLNSLSKGKLTPLIEQLVAKWVIIGLPAHYLQ